MQSVNVSFYYGRQPRACTPACLLIFCSVTRRTRGRYGVPNERDSEYAPSTEVTEIEFHRRASDYPARARGDELHATLSEIASRAYLCLCTFYPLEPSVKRAADETDGGITARCSCEELKHRIHTWPRLRQHRHVCHFPPALLLLLLRSLSLSLLYQRYCTRSDDHT